LLDSRRFVARWSPVSCREKLRFFYYLLVILQKKWAHTGERVDLAPKNGFTGEIRLSLKEHEEQAEANT
jgi:CRISPR/Cas system endoribonuclease Cas6 (RAMP superfamily)